MCAPAIFLHTKMFEFWYQCLMEIQFGHAHVCVGHYLQLPSVRDEALKALVDFFFIFLRLVKFSAPHAW
jgi:hypothetical protein